MVSEFQRIIGTIRTHSLVVVGALAFVPLLFVLGTPSYQNLVQQQLIRGAEEAARESNSLRNGGHVTGMARIADRHGARVRKIVSDGSVVSDHGDAIRGRWTHHVTLRFADDHDREAIHNFDAALPPLTERPEVLAAMRGHDATVCSMQAEGGVLVCHHATRAADGGVIHAQKAAVQTVSRLYGERFSIVALVLQTLIVALLLGWWLGRRTIRPIDRLRQQVAERTRPPVSTDSVSVRGSDEIADLGRAFNELLEALRAQRHANMDFLAEVAHELKTPIATVQQFAELVRESGDPSMERALSGVEKSVGRLNARVDELMELARAEAGLPQAERSRVRLDHLVENLLEAYGSDLRHGGLSFQGDLEPVELSASPRHLETALRNLVENAAQHANRQVVVSLERLEGEVVLLIRDDGPGIAPEELERVFERFYTGREAGTGLGLPVARAIIRAHAGTIRLASPPDGGMTAEIRLGLPAVTPEPQANQE